MPANRLTAIGLLAAFLARADEPPPDAARIAEAVRDLGHADFRIREEAFSRLLDWKDRHPKEIGELLPENPTDPEVRARCRILRETAGVEAFRRQTLVQTARHPAFCRKFEMLMDALAGDQREAALAALTELRDKVLPDMNTLLGPDEEEAFATHRAYGDVCAWLLENRIGGGALGKKALEWIVFTRDPRARGIAESLFRSRPGDGETRADQKEALAFSELRADALHAYATGALGVKARDRRAAALERLDDPSEESEVRYRALLALHDAGDRCALDTALARLSDFDPEIRLLAAQIVRERAEPEHVPAALKFLEGFLGEIPGSLQCRQANAVAAHQLLVETLGEMDDPAAIPLLALHLDRLSPKNLAKAGPDAQAYGRNVRYAAAVALGKLKARNQTSQLLEMLRDQDPLEGRVNRRAAATALGFLGDRAHLAALEPLLKDSAKEVRDAARTALEKLKR